MSKWKELDGLVKNSILRGDDFYISYAPGSELANMGSFMASEEGSDETALCIDGKFYVLNGDYRAEYEELVPEGKDACFAFYTKQNTKSVWSGK